MRLVLQLRVNFQLPHLYAIFCDLETVAVAVECYARVRLAGIGLWQDLDPAEWWSAPSSKVHLRRVKVRLQKSAYSLYAVQIKDTESVKFSRCDSRVHH